MVSTPVRSWGRPTAVVSGAAVMVGLAGAWLTPTTADSARPASLGSGQNVMVSTAPVRPVAYVTPMSSVWLAAGGLGGGPGGGLGDGPGGGSDGSGGSSVAPSPARHGSGSGSSSSSSGGSVSRHVSSSSAPSSDGPGPVQTAFNTVGRWLGFSRHSSEGSGGADHDSAAAAPKPAKHAAGAGAGGGSGSGSGGGPDAAASSGVGGLVHSVLSGVGRLIGGLFGH
jgi:hypothetical protein